MAANRVQATTVTRPSDPGSPPSQAAERLTSAWAMPPKRMKAAAITNSGSAIRVGEFSSLMTSCAAPTSGWPDSAYMAPEQSPSTRKTGIPIARNPTKNVRKLVIGGSIDAEQVVAAVMARAGEIRSRCAHQSDQPDDIADQHQCAARRQRRIIDPHWKPQVRRAALVDQARCLDNLPAIPDQRAAEHDGRGAIEHLHPPQQPAGDDIEDEVGPDMAVGAHELARHDHDGPDHEVDDHLLGIADRTLRQEVAREDLPKGERQCDEA